MLKRFVLDTHIYDEIVSVPGMPERLADLYRAGKIVILQSHIERDELSQNPNEHERIATLAVVVEPIPTSGAVWGVSKWGEATWGDGGSEVWIQDVRSEAANHVRDALIATTASENADVLVTHDKRLNNRVRQASDFPVWTFLQFTEFIASLES